MSRLKCCVPGCSASDDVKKILHTFPNPVKDKERFKAWIFAIGGEIIGLDNDFIFKQRRVCRLHFEERFLNRNNRISNNAVPTLHLRGHSRFSQAVRETLRVQPTVPLAVASTSREPLMPCPVDERFLIASPHCLEPVATTSKAILTTPEHEDKENEPSNIHSKANINIEAKLRDTVSTSYLKTGVKRKITAKPDAEPLMPRPVDERFLIASPHCLEPVATTSKAILTTPEHEDKENEPSNIHSKANINIKAKLRDTVSTSYPKTGVKRKITAKPDAEAPKKHVKKFWTTSELAISKKIKTMRVKISKLKSKSKKLSANLKAANSLMSNRTFVSTIEKLPTAGKILTLMQLRECEKKDKGRRFTMSEKIVALTILKQSPKCYRFLRKVFILPAHQTLIKLIHQANVTPGINDKMFQQLKSVTSKMKTQHRLCVVLFDEMALKANVTYNERKDKVIGFVNNGEETLAEFADHAQVFMIRGLIKNYKQAVSYSFSNAATKGPELAKQLKIVIKKLMEAGFIVVGTICDQGTNNRQAIKLLLEEARANFLRGGQEPKNNTFLVDGHEVVPMYDPPHLLKCVRNNLLTKNLKYKYNGEIRTAKWDHILSLHKENPGYRSLRLISKLSDSHVISTKIPKMKVKYASQLFSQTVGSNMGYLADKGILSGECRETADLLLFFDQLFDSMNGSFTKKGKEGKPLLQPAKPNSPHHKTWNEAKKYLKEMKFINKENGKIENVPTLTNWAWTLDSIQLLLKNLHERYQINSVWMRHLNQDPLENFFGAVRMHGCRNTNPTPENFSSAFTTLLINNLSSVHAPSANCENDLSENLHALIITDTVKTCSTVELDDIPNIVLINLEAKSDPRVLGPLQYVTGYFARNAQKKVFKSCKICRKNVVAPEPLEYIKYREFTGKQWLCSPTSQILECFSAIQDIQVILKNIIYKNNIKEFLKTLILVHINFEFLNCEEHQEQLIEFIINSTCNFFIHTYCKNINRILNGTMEINDHEDIFQKKAKHYHAKFVKKLVKK